MQPSREIDRLLEIMAALRQPESGCCWDLEQTFETVAPFTIEEAYEVADAILRCDMPDLKEELGDLLLQVVFHAKIAEERGCFDFGAVVEAITSKMIRRHPHVFGKERGIEPKEVEVLWSRIKDEEKSERRATSGETASKGLLDDIPLALPGLTRAVKLQKQAAKIGFDWDDVRLVVEKVREEIGEVEAALLEGAPDAIREEIGDLLCAAANLARHVNVDPEDAIRCSNAKFERRFRYIETALRRNESGSNPTLDEMEKLWREAKLAEKRP